MYIYIYMYICVYHLQHFYGMTQENKLAKLRKKTQYCNCMTCDKMANTAMIFRRIYSGNSQNEDACKHEHVKEAANMAETMVMLWPS